MARSRLHCYAYGGDLAALQTELTRLGPAAIESEDNHQTPLMVATIAARASVVTYLLAQGANLSVTNSSGWRLLNLLANSIRIAEQEKKEIDLIDRYMKIADLLLREEAKRVALDELGENYILLLHHKTGGGKTPIEQLNGCVAQQLFQAVIDQVQAEYPTIYLANEAAQSSHAAIMASLELNQPANRSAVTSLHRHQSSILSLSPLKRALNWLSSTPSSPATTSDDQQALLTKKRL